MTEPRGSDDPPGAKAFVCTFPSAQGDDLQAKSSGQRVSDSHRCCFFQGPSPFSLSVNSAHRHSRHHLQPPVTCPLCHHLDSSRCSHLLTDPSLDNRPNGPESTLLAKLT